MCWQKEEDFQATLTPLLPSHGMLAREPAAILLPRPSRHHHLATCYPQEQSGWVQLERDNGQRQSWGTSWGPCSCPGHAVVAKTPLTQSSGCAELL